MVDNEFWGFIVDTNTYSGNFERPLCAWMTGTYGECGVGEMAAEAFAKEFPDNPFENMVMRVPDEHGCHRPVSIYPTPGWFNAGGKHYRDSYDEAEAIRYIREKWLAAANECSYAPSAERFLKLAEEAELVKYPAYQSVLIYFNCEPTQEQINILKHRAMLFELMWNSGDSLRILERFESDTQIAVAGFRLIHFGVIEERNL